MRRVLTIALGICLTGFGACREKPDQREAPLGLLYYEASPVGWDDDLIVRFVWPNSPAAAAGVHRHDVLLFVADRAVTSRASLHELWRVTTDSCSEVVVRRDGVQLKLPCLRRFATKGLNAQTMNDLADEKAPVVLIEGAVNRPGLYVRGAYSLDELLAQAGPVNAVDVCISVSGPSSRIRAEECGPLNNLAGWIQGQPDVSYHLKVRPIAIADEPCGILSDVPISEIEMSATASHNTVVLIAPSHGSQAATLGMRVGQECAELVEVGLACSKLRQGEREYRICRADADAGT